MTLVVTRASEAGASAARFGGFRRGLERRGWDVSVVDIRGGGLSRLGAAVDQRIPQRLRTLLYRAGFENDVQPSLAVHAYSVLRRLDTGVVMISAPPYSFLGVGWFLPRHVPLVLDVRDPWGACDAPTPLARYTTWLERYALRRASYITYCGSLTFGKQMVARLGVGAERVVSVPNGVDPEDFEGLETPRPRPERNGSPLDLVFGGYWYGRNGPCSVPQVLAQVGPSIARLTVIGGMGDEIRDEFERCGVSVTVEAPLPRAKLYHRLIDADLCLVTLGSGAIEARIPTKVYELSALGVPVLALCDDRSALWGLAEAQHFYRHRPADERGIADLLRSAAADRQTLDAGGGGVRVPRDKGAEQLHQVLLRAWEEGRPCVESPVSGPKHSL